jgi:hypothetical protein
MTRLYFLNQCQASKGLLHKSRCTIWFYNVPSILYDDFMVIVKPYLQRCILLHLTGSLHGVLTSVFNRRRRKQEVRREFVTDFVPYTLRKFTKFSIQRRTKQTTDRSGHPYPIRPYVDKDVLKDGIHIVFKNVHLTGTIQQLLRRRVLSANLSYRHRWINSAEGMHTPRPTIGKCTGAANW